MNITEVRKAHKEKEKNALILIQPLFDKLRLSALGFGKISVHQKPYCQSQVFSCIHNQLPISLRVKYNEDVISIQIDSHPPLSDKRYHFKGSHLVGLVKRLVALGCVKAKAMQRQFKINNLEL